MRMIGLISMLVVPLVAGWLQAQDGEPRMPATLQEGLLARFDEAAGKMVQLAEAIPANKYGWHPAPKVRTVSQVLVHVGMANYYTIEGAGRTSPVKLREDEETTFAAKPAVIQFLKQSNAHMRSVLSGLQPADLAQPVTMFGQQTTAGNAYLFGVTHLHEHLGQLVSYARANGVVPPWSMKKQ
jgi:uncharacterized damage-inducible protein DinB